MRVVIVAMIVMTSGAAADDKPLKGNVLVWADAKWYVDADDKSATIRLGDLKATRTVGRVVTAKVVATSGDFVEVELADGCAWSKVTSELAALRLFVKRADLANVLVKPFAKTYKNGSRLTLAAGVPIEGSKISINGEEVEVAVPPESIGLSYPPAKVKRPAPIPLTVKNHYSLDGEAMLGDFKITTKQIATRVTKRGKEVLFPIRATCIDAMVVAPGEAVAQNAMDGIGGPLPGGVGGIIRPIQERWYIARGTPLLSASGRAVAKTRMQIDVPKPEGKPACIKSEVDLELVDREAPRIEETKAGERTLELCVPAAQIKHENPMPPKP